MMEIEPLDRGLGRRAANGLQQALGWLYAFMMGGILLICLFLSHIEFSRKELTLGFFPAILLVIFGVLFLFGFYPFCVKLAGLNPGKRALLAATVLLFSLQIFAVYNYWFYTAWDVSALTTQASATVHGEDNSAMCWYFSEFPNNLMLVWVFTVIQKVAHAIGLHAYEYFALICVQCLLNSLTGLLLAQVLYKLFRSRTLVALGYALYVFLVGISPWVSIPYSDSMGLPFPLLVLAVYVNRERARYKWLPWMGMAAIAVIGYKIKPQLLIAFLAVLIAETLRVLRAGSIRKKFFRIAAGGAVVLLGVVCALLFSKVAIRTTRIWVDPESAFQAPHYFMMGLNTETMGAYYGEDNLFSSSYPSVAERNRANLERAAERIKEMGFTGVSKQLVRKTLTNYYDGTFAWGGEGGFFTKQVEERDDPFCDFFQKLYYTKQYANVGIYYPLWSNFEQMIWLTILFFNVAAGLGPKSPEKDVVLLSIIGLTLFELLFEARARYLFTYTPFYIIAALYGFRLIKEKLDSRSSREHRDEME